MATDQDASGPGSVTREAVHNSTTPMPPNIRLATADDSEALAWLTQELLTFYGLPLRYQRSYMDHAISAGAFTEYSGLKILLACNNSAPIGFLAFSEIFALAACQRSIFIQDLFVARKARRSGAGRALMDALIHHAHENQVTQIDWTADPWNSNAARFYEKIGPLLKSEKIFYRLPQERLKSFLRK